MITWIIIVLLIMMVGVLVYKVSRFEKEMWNMEFKLKERIYDAERYRSNVNSNLKMVECMQNDAWEHFTKIEKLNSSYQDGVNAAINEIYFRLDNNPLYEVGNKVDKDWIVTSADLVSHPKMQYNYTATNIKTGETKTWAE